MPHIIIEHDKEISKEINLSELTQQIHICMSQQDTVTLDALRTRTRKAKNVIIGDGSNNKMIHIDVVLLEGRSEELKGKMANDIFNIAKNCIGEIKCCITVNIQELGVYIK